MTMLPGLYLAVRAGLDRRAAQQPSAEDPLLRGLLRMGPGPAAGELDRGDWLVTEAEADTVFLKDTSRLWQDMVRRASAVRADAAPMR